MFSHSSLQRQKEILKFIFIYFVIYSYIAIVVWGNRTTAGEPGHHCDFSFPTLASMLAEEVHIQYTFLHIFLCGSSERGGLCLLGSFQCSLLTEDMLLPHPSASSTKSHRHTLERTRAVCPGASNFPQP